MIGRWLAPLGMAPRVAGCLTGLARRLMRQEIAELTRTFTATTEALQAKIQELEASRSRIEGLLERMTEGVLAVGPHEELLLMNPAARAILGTDLIRRPELQTLLRETVATGRDQVRDLTLYAPQERHLRVRATTWGTSGGSGALLVLHDITDLMRLEHLRREFVANVSHELKTPLTAIRGAVETLLDGALADPAAARPFAESIAEEAGRLQRLVEDLLTLAQVETKQVAPPWEPIAIGSFLQQEVARHQPLAHRHSVSLTLEVADPSLTVAADRAQLVQAVGNLLDNAIKYNRPGGRVTVRAEAAGRQLQLTVEDTGIGIPPGDLPRVFERFYRVDKARSRATGGTGLGLSIVKHVAEQHGGTVAVESQPGRGSRFTLTLPL